MSGADDIDAYIADLTPLRRERIGAVVSAVRRLFPDVGQGIEYKMPYFRRGEQYFGVANRSDSVALYLGVQAATVIASDPKLKGGKGCVNVRDTVSMPMAALEDAIKARFAG